MHLRYDPYAVFRDSQTPAGLYARQKWLAESESSAWQSDFRKTVKRLETGQRPDGSWQQSELETITRLFGLHLTVREPDAGITAGLDWLLGRLAHPPENRTVRPAPDDSLFRGLPFVPGDPEALLQGGVLFLATIFGRSRDPGIRERYRAMDGGLFSGPAVWSDPRATSNLFRALVVHPEFSRTNAVRAAVRQLADLQSADGDWQPPLPFYQILNALAHLDCPEADQQLARAFDQLAARQNKDGSWGRFDPEWNTFLAVHALRNKGHL